LSKKEKKKRPVRCGKDARAGGGAEKGEDGEKKERMSNVVGARGTWFGLDSHHWVDLKRFV